MGSKTYPGDVWVLSIIDTKESSKLQQQFCAHWGIAMNPCYKADLGLRWFSFTWFVGDFQSPNGSKFDTLAKTGHGREREYNKKISKEDSLTGFMLVIQMIRGIEVSCKNNYASLKRNEESWFKCRTGR